MCKHCINCISEYDGDYCGYSYTYCSEDQPSQNLKGFPFTKPPKSCIKNKIFKLNYDSYPNHWHGWGVVGFICDSICQQATKTYKDCDITTCEAFRYILGRTDIYLHNIESTTIAYQKMLAGKKLTYKDKKGKKHFFKVRITEKCSNCNGEGILGDYNHPCPKCEYRGVIDIGTKLP